MPLILRRSLFFVLWCASVLIAAKLTTPPVHAEQVNYGCTKCVEIKHSVPSIADPSRTTMTEGPDRRCLERDNIPPSHCCLINRKHYTYYNDRSEVVSDEYEEDCANILFTTTDSCPFIQQATPAPSPTPVP